MAIRYAGGDEWSNDLVSDEVVQYEALPVPPATGRYSYVAGDEERRKMKEKAIQEAAAADKDVLDAAREMGAILLHAYVAVPLHPGAEQDPEVRCMCGEVHIRIVEPKEERDIPPVVLNTNAAHYRESALALPEPPPA